MGAATQKFPGESGFEVMPQLPGPSGIETAIEIIVQDATPQISNIYHAGHLTFEAKFDRVLVIEDEFRSGYECDRCEKSGKILCPDCDNGSSRLNPEVRCKSCAGEHKIDCPDCNGKGETIVIPDTAKRRPTTGQIVSIGSEVKGWQLGESACYPNFCGEVWDLSGIDIDGVERTIVLRIMKERELLCGITGQLSVRRMKNRASQISG
jgi:hypothetical protein